MLFTELEIDRIKIALGYPSNDPLFESVQTQLGAISSPSRKDKIISLLDDIDTLEGKLETSIDKTNVKKVDTIELDNSNLVQSYIREGNRKIKQLSALTELDIKYNMFKPNGDCKYSFRSLT